jgi:hypothetical protein
MENSNKNPVSFTLFPRGINPNPNETNQLQWNLSNLTHQWTREMPFTVKLVGSEFKVVCPRSDISICGL